MKCETSSGVPAAKMPATIAAAVDLPVPISHGRTDAVTPLKPDRRWRIRGVVCEDGSLGRRSECQCGGAAGADRAGDAKHVRRNVWVRPPHPVSWGRRGGGRRRAHGHMGLEVARAGPQLVPRSPPRAGRRRPGKRSNDRATMRRPRRFSPWTGRPRAARPAGPACTSC